GGGRVRTLTVDGGPDAMISVATRRHRRAIDQEAHRRAVRVIAVEREQDRLLARLGLAPGTVREKAVVAKGPQVRVERLDSLLRSRLHDHAPAALERFFDQRGKHTLERLSLQLVKYDFRHDDRATVARAPTSPLRSQRTSHHFS